MKYFTDEVFTLDVDASFWCPIDGLEALEDESYIQKRLNLIKSMTKWIKKSSISHIYRNSIRGKTQIYQVIIYQPA